MTISDEDLEREAERFKKRMQQGREANQRKKQAAKLDKLLGYAFARSTQVTVEAAQDALNNKDGKLVINLDSSGSKPSLLERINLGAIRRWFAPHNIEGLDEHFVKRNADFSQYKELLKSQDIEIERIEVIPAANGVGIHNYNKAITTLLAVATPTAALLGAPKEIFALSASAGLVSYINERIQVLAPNATQDTSHQIAIQLTKSGPSAPTI